MKCLKKVFALIFMLVFVGVGVLSNVGTISQVDAAAKISVKKKTLLQGKSVNLKITGGKGTIKWSVNNDNVKLNKTTGKKVKVTAVKAGKSKVTANVKGKKLTCTIKVNGLNIVNKELTVGQKFTLKVKGLGKKVKWSQTGNVVAVSGKKAKATVTAKKEGTGTVIAKVGKKSYKCTVVVKHVHKTVTIPGKAATCVEPGLTAGTKCSVCGTIVTAQKEIAPLAHATIHFEAIEPACHYNGQVEYWYCPDCEGFWTDAACTQVTNSKSVVLPATGSENLQHVEAVEPTATEDGNVEYWYCLDCEGYWLDEACTRLTNGLSVILGATGESTDSALALDKVDFVVEVESGREPVVLQISDTQIIDSSQERYAERLSDAGDVFWGPDMFDERLFDNLTETIEETNPDLILITGDVVYGEFDDNGTVLLSLIEKMESFGIPWAPVFGNHDNESAMGVDWQCEQFEKAEHCLFKQRTLTGNGNYTVGIKQDGELKRVFFMMDSNGCGALHENSKKNGHTTSAVGFGQDQMDWSIALAEEIKELSPDTKLSFAFHIQIYAFKDAYKKYGFTNSGTKENPINIDKLENKAEGDFGYLGRDLKGPWDSGNTFYKRMKAVGVDSIFVGHEHCNSASVVYEGIRFQFSQKIGTYDRTNYLMPDGTIVGGTNSSDKPLSGGTVMLLGEDGSIKNAYIYLSGNVKSDEGGADEEPEEPAVPVNGLQVGTDLSADSNIKKITSTTIDGENAWKVDAAYGQGKVYMDLSLLEGAKSFTFSVYVPEETTTIMNVPPEYPLFCIRVKKTSTDKYPTFGSCNGGYVRYSTTVDDVNHKLLYKQWQTFTVDLTEMPETCSEFAFIIENSNVIYLKDIAFEY